MYANPKQTATGPTVVGGIPINPGPNAVRDKPRREASQFMVGNRTTATVDAHLFDIAMGYTYTDDIFRFPISSGVRTTQGGDFTGVARYAYNPAAALLPLFETTAQYSVGSADRGYYLNQSGQTGAQFGANELKAQTLSLLRRRQRPGLAALGGVAGDLLCLCDARQRRCVRFGTASHDRLQSGEPDRAAAERFGGDSGHQLFPQLFGLESEPGTAPIGRTRCRLSSSPAARASSRRPMTI